MWKKLVELGEEAALLCQSQTKKEDSQVHQVVMAVVVAVIDSILVVGHQVLLVEVLGLMAVMMLKWRGMQTGLVGFVAVWP